MRNNHSIVVVETSSVKPGLQRLNKPGLDLRVRGVGLVVRKLGSGGATISKKVYGVDMPVWFPYCQVLQVLDEKAKPCSVTMDEYHVLVGLDVCWGNVELVDVVIFVVYHCFDYLGLMRICWVGVERQYR
ncbi:hypothetical protein OGAPHI_002548 [Ogataea philodendri]|uniref:Uncharacterized protein n=1 Tax=Ogataea philodendri TaxID=1378263 RepID=A0A9P8T755_9ASCO|nr:uncharacterized protein OGAPHI_002548 [Ogataea philodendri]KAH3668793.1 hypothetical protein OGAPHI_002548 [Ogataea philodendri]